MATSIMDVGYRIGIELELLWTPKEQQTGDFTDLEAFARYVVPQAVRDMTNQERAALQAKMDEGAKRNPMRKKFGLWPARTDE